jgi:hypothetical protein
MQITPRSSARTWLSLAGIAVLIATPVISYYALPHLGLPAVLVSWAILLMVAKHLGLLAVLLGPLYALRRRRMRQLKPRSPMSAAQTPGLVDLKITDKSGEE